MIHSFDSIDLTTSSYLSASAGQFVCLLYKETVRIRRPVSRTGRIRERSLRARPVLTPTRKHRKTAVEGNSCRRVTTAVEMEES